MSRKNDPSEQAGYDAVREKLLDRGYLDHGLERFLLGDVSRSRSPLIGVIRTALKAAVLGAPLLGGILAVATVVANRPLLDGFDGVVIWGWLALLSAAGLFTLDLAAAGIVAVLAGGRDPVAGDSFRGALMVGLPLLGYIGLLWWKRTSGLGLIADVLFVVSALVVAALVGWSARYVSLAVVIGKTGKVPLRARRGLPTLALILLPLALVFLLMPREGAGGLPGIPADNFELPADRPRLIMIGVDGLDGDLVEELAESGALENLLATMARGTVFPTRRSAGKEPAEVWTTCLTGVPPEEHKVLGAGEGRLPGVATPIRPGSGPLPLEAALAFLLPVETVPATGARRTVRTVWEIAGLKEPTAAVGWWASWPAEENLAGGYVVTDRVLPKILSDATGDRDTWPQALFARLEADYQRSKAELDAGYHRWFGDIPVVGETGRLLRESYLIDQFALGTITTLMEDRTVRSGYVYLPGLDILRTRLGGARVSEPVARYVAWLDHAIGAGILAEKQLEIVLVADPGRSAKGSEEGFVVLAGPTILAGCLGDSLDPLQITPLILQILQYPASSEMPGQAPDLCLADSPTRDIPEIGSFGRRPVSEGSPVSEYDPELVERLRSLGYIQ